MFLARAYRSKEFAQLNIVIVTYFPLQIELDYSYSVGNLKPYFDALSAGEALASRCPQCGFVSFPPRIVCQKDHQQTKWFPLDGRGEIVAVTHSKDTNHQPTYFALIKMQGADNYTLGRLFSKEIKKGDLVHIASVKTKVDHPAQSAYFKLTADDN